MKIIEIRVMAGPNYWSVQRHKLIKMVLDLQGLEKLPTNLIPGFFERLETLIPTLSSHLCTEGVAGSFLDRVRSGTWMGKVVEHIALEIQSLAGMDTFFGQTVETDKKGIYEVVFSYTEAEAGKYAAQASVHIAEALVSGKEYSINEDIEELKWIAQQQFTGPSTNSIIKEAENRDIPFIRLDDQSYIQLGHGARQKRILATVASTTSNIAVELAGDKEATKNLLAKANVPVPKGEIFYNEEELKAAIENIGYPIAIKPVDGNHGKGAAANIHNFEEAAKAMEAAQQYSRRMICEKFVPGSDFRALVINYQFVAAALRTPASVTGDGVCNIQELIDLENKNPKRGKGHDNLLTFIKTDSATIELLKQKGYTPDTILPLNQQCLLKATANLSTGGTATDVTDMVHPSNISLFERIARIIGLDICGIDIIASSLSTAIKENGGAILEVNAAPGFRMHLSPSIGKPRNVAAPVVDMLFPNGSRGIIPVVAVSGTNGKTTTTRLVAHIVKKAGYQTGFTTTDGVYIQDDLVLQGDCSGPASAQFLLKDPAVEFAVFECARGGILRAGLGFPFCQVAIITNVAEDHLGLNGIDTIEKLARVKSVVAESVVSEGYSVLNADDDLVYAMKDKVKSKVALFSMYENSHRIKLHCGEGGLAAIFSHNYIVLMQGSKKIKIDKVQNIPVTLGGKAAFNISNVLAATLAAYVSNINLDDIRQGLQSFVPSPETTPGRMNMFEFNEFTVMVDYAHNTHAIQALGKFIKNIKASVKVGIIAGVGDRRDVDLINVGEESSKIFDEIIIRLDEDLRGRTGDEIFHLVTMGIKKFDPNKKILLNNSEIASVEHAISNAKTGAFIVVLTENIAEVVAGIRKLQQKQRKQTEASAGLN